jgi:hypothetical protein
MGENKLNSDHFFLFECSRWSFFRSALELLVEISVQFGICSFRVLFCTGYQFMLPKIDLLLT